MPLRGTVARLLTADRVAAGLFLVAVAVYGWESWQFTASLEVDVVGPAFFPKILTVVGAILGVSLLLQRAPQGSGGVAGPGGHLTALVPAGLLLGYIFLFEPLGFLIATTIFLFATFRYLGSRGRGALLLAVVTTAACYILFHSVLEVRLPLGFLARLL